MIFLFLAIEADLVTVLLIVLVYLTNKHKATVSSWSDSPLSPSVRVMKSVSSKHKKFGQHIRELRTARGLTQEMLAEKIAVDRSYMGFLERGERNPSLTIIIEIAKALKVSPADLLQGL